MTASSPVSFEECNKQGVIFSLANRLGHDLATYADRYLRSSFVSGTGDFEYSYCQIAAPSYSLDLVDDEELHARQKTDGVSNDEAYWIGFFYRYVALALAIKSAEAAEKVPFERMRGLYAAWGTLPKEEAADRFLAFLREA